MIRLGCLCPIVVSKMVFVTHPSFDSDAILKSENSNTSKNKIPEYAKDFKNEWLYITGINKKCGEFMKIIGDNTDSVEKIFSSPRVKALIEHFKNVLEAQKMGKLQNISKLKFKLSAVYRIIDLRFDLYYHMGTTFYTDFIISDDDFQDFFENFIIFTNNVNIKNEEDFEDDLFDVRAYIEDHEENDIDSDDSFIDEDLFNRIIDGDSDDDDDF